MPATLDDVARIASELPEVEEVVRHGARTWTVAGKVFTWESAMAPARLARR